MNNVVMAVCRWLEDTSWAVTIRESALAYPVMQWIHFIGLSLWLGACLTVDLRLIGVGQRRQAAAELSNGLFAWKWIGFGVAFAGGFPLFAAVVTAAVGFLLTNVS